MKKLIGVLMMMPMIVLIAYLLSQYQSSIYIVFAAIGFAILLLIWFMFFCGLDKFLER